jgi:ectoine hydroxylase-related dioxygenase (phytanoyl-CoA dioxygenase family)
MHVERYVPFHELLQEDDPFNIYGYEIFHHNYPNLFYDLKIQFSNYIKDKLKDFSEAARALDSFEIERYHHVLQKYNIDHHSFIKFCTRVMPEDFYTHPYIQRILRIAYERTGYNFKVYDNRVEFRVVRPGYGDSNDYHRDHWFPYFTPLINLYIPLGGSYYDSSLCIMPFSHKFTEEEVVPTFTYQDILQGKKYVKDGVLYSAPTIARSDKEIVMHRPDVIEGDFMMFSPKLIHGGATNMSQNTTRFSFEIRIERI